MTSLGFREATRADIRTHILPIERASYAAPWPEDLFAAEFDKPMARVTLAERRGTVVGYVVHWVLLDEAHILNVAVAPAARRTGIGRALVEFVIDRARREAALYVTLEVRAGNEAGLGLYGRLGFRRVGLRRRYYADNGEDALILGLLLTADSDA